MRPPYVFSETDLTKCGFVSDGVLVGFSYRLLDIYVTVRELGIYTIPNHTDVLAS